MKKEDKAKLPQHLRFQMHPPSGTLFEKIEEMGIGTKVLATLSGLDEETIRSVLADTTKVNQEIAEGLEKATKIPTSFWLRSQQLYDEHVEFWRGKKR